MRPRSAPRSIASLSENNRSLRAGAICRGLSRRMAYKDEYEVARLFVEGRFKRELDAQSEGNYRVRFNFAAPLLSLGRGSPRKRELGPWMWMLLPLLARLKILRGTPFDPFGWTAERRLERALVREYMEILDEISATLTASNYDYALEIANLPDT